MGWRYRAGLLLIAAVVIIWVTSAEVTQDIFTDYKQPFAVTYLGASLMVVYLPIAYLKDWLCKLLRQRNSKGDKHAESTGETSAGSSPSLKYIGVQNVFEVESALARKDSEADLSSNGETSPLVSKRKDDRKRGLTTREIAICGCYIAPICIYQMRPLQEQVLLVRLYYRPLQVFSLCSSAFFWAKIL